MAATEKIDNQFKAKHLSLVHLGEMRRVPRGCLRDTGYCAYGDKLKDHSLEVEGKPCSLQPER